jgi:hypothetical protein
VVLAALVALVGQSQQELEEVLPLIEPPEQLTLLG